MQSKLSVAFAAAIALFVTIGAPARANVLQAYTVDWSGTAGLGDPNARASAVITLDLTQLPNPGLTDGPLSPFITALSLTITGATSGNGTFGLSDFAAFSWDTGGATLNMLAPLVGQSGWGTCQNGCGDFNLFGSQVANGAGVFPPFGSDLFTLQTDNATQDQLVLTSFDPVPLPTALPLFATGIAGLGLLGWRRRRKAKAVA